MRSPRPASQGLETETADDFVLTQATVVSGATIHGLIPVLCSGIARVEVEIYHIFPLDSDTVRAQNVPIRRTRLLTWKSTLPHTIPVTAA